MSSRDAESRGPAVVATIVVFTVLATLSVVLRLISRIVCLKNPGRDELTIVASLVRIRAPILDSVGWPEFATDSITTDLLHCYASDANKTQVNLIPQQLRVSNLVCEQKLKMAWENMCLL